MIELNLVTNTEPEKRILEYLQNNVSETLADKINNGSPFEKDGKPLLNKKTLADFMKYACDEARKLAEKGANSACIEDSVVYGWAIHYFEEESIVGTLYNADGTEYKPAVKVAAKSITKPVVTETKPKQVQWSLFDMLNVRCVIPPKSDGKFVVLLSTFDGRITLGKPLVSIPNKFIK